MKKRVLSLFMAFVLCLTLLPAPALAVTDTADAHAAEQQAESQDPEGPETSGAPEENGGGAAAQMQTGAVDYVYAEDSNGKRLTETANQAYLINSDTELVLDKEWYAVTGEVAIDHDVMFKAAAVSLILCNNAKLTINGTLTITDQLNIYGQTENVAYSGSVGSLTVKNENGYAIAAASAEGAAITFYGGSVRLSGSPNALDGNVTLNAAPQMGMYCAVGDYSSGSGDKQALDVWQNNSGFNALAFYVDEEGEYHDGFVYTPDGDDQHFAVCKHCGYSEGGVDENGDPLPAACEFSDVDGYIRDETGHYKKCLCGNKGEGAAHVYTYIDPEDGQAHASIFPTEDGQNHVRQCAMCGYENGEPESHFKYFDETYTCTECGFVQVATNNNSKMFDDLDKALHAGGSQVYIQAKTKVGPNKVLGVDASVTFDPEDEEWKATSEQSVELVMDGKILYNDVGSTLNVYSGTLEVNDWSSSTPMIQILQDGWESGNGASAVSLRNGTLIFKKDLFASGGYRSSGEGNAQYPAVAAYGGTLRFNGNVALEGGLYLSFDAKLETPLKAGDRFYAKADSGKNLSNTETLSIEGSTVYSSLAELLEDGCAFAYCDADGNYVDANGKAVTEPVVLNVRESTSLKENVTVVEHEHKFKVNSDLNWVCACGETCAHGNVDENGKCGTCKAQFAAECDGTYFIDLYKAIVASIYSGKTVTVLTNTYLGTITPKLGNAVLDLNGKTVTGTIKVSGTKTTFQIMGEGTFKGDMDVSQGAALTLTGTGTMDGTIDARGAEEENTKLLLTDGWSGTVENIALQGFVQFEISSGTVSNALIVQNCTTAQAKTLNITGGTFGMFGNTFSPGVDKTTGYATLQDLVADGYTLQKTKDGSYLTAEERAGFEILEEVRVVTCEHVYETTGVCKNCGAACPHEHVDADGVCKDCGKQAMLAKVGEEFFSDFQKALQAAGNGKTTLVLLDDVTLLGEEGWFGSGNGTTIDLNGKTIRGDALGLNTRTKATLTDSSEAQTGGFGDPLYIAGQCTILGGSYTTLVIRPNGSAEISGCKITQTIRCETGSGQQVKDVLKSGHAVYLVNGSDGSAAAVNGYVTELTAPTDGSHYEIREHSHSFGEKQSDGKYYCACGLGCAHANVPETGENAGLCPDCGTQFAAKVTDADRNVTYYADGLNDRGNMAHGMFHALKNAPDGSTVKALTSGTYNVTITGGRTLTLDMNGTTNDGGRIDIGEIRGDNKTADTGNTLILTGNGKFVSKAWGEMVYNTLTVYVGNKLIVDENWSGDLGYISLNLVFRDYDAATAQFYGGAINILFASAISEKTVSIGEWLAEGYAFRHTDGEKAWVRYDTELTSASRDGKDKLNNLEVVQCPHASFENGKCVYCNYECTHETIDPTGTCTVCGLEYAAKIGDVYYTSLYDAFRAAQDGDTITLLRDTWENYALPAADGKTLTLNMNGCSLSGDAWLYAGHQLIYDTEEELKAHAGTLKITGQGDLFQKSGSTGRILVRGYSTLDLSEWKGTAVRAIEVEANAKVILPASSSCTVGALTLRGAVTDGLLKWSDSAPKYSPVFGVIQKVDDKVPACTLGQLLKNVPKEGCAFYTGSAEEGYEALAYTTEITAEGVKDVTLMACFHADADFDTMCDYCNAQLSAKHETFNAAGELVETTYIRLREPGKIADCVRSATGAKQVLTLLSHADSQVTLTNASVPLTLTRAGYSGNYYGCNTNFIFDHIEATVTDGDYGGTLTANANATLHIAGGWAEAVVLRGNDGTLTGGRFNRITLTDGQKTLTGYLGDGYAFASKNDSNVILSGNGTELTDVEVVPHVEAPDANGECACGRAFRASVTAGDVTAWYKTLPEAAEAANRTDGAKTIRLYQDYSGVSANQQIVLTNGPVTLDLNGKNIQHILKANGITLTVQGAGTISNLHAAANEDAQSTLMINSYGVTVSTVTVYDASTAKISAGSYGTLYLYDATAKAELSGGKYGQITRGYSTPALKDLLVSGYAYRNKAADNKGTWVTREELEAGGTLTNVTVEPAPVTLAMLGDESFTAVFGDVVGSGIYLMLEAGASEGNAFTADLTLRLYVNGEQVGDARTFSTSNTREYYNVGAMFANVSVGTYTDCLMEVTYRGCTIDTEPFTVTVLPSKAELRASLLAEQDEESGYVSVAGGSCGYGTPLLVNALLLGTGERLENTRRIAAHGAPSQPEEDYFVVKDAAGNELSARVARDEQNASLDGNGRLNYTASLPLTQALRAGTHTLTVEYVSGSGANTGGASVTLSVTVTKKAIAPDVTLALPEGGCVYDGTEQRPEVRVKDGAAELPAAEYTVEYRDHTAAGTATVTVRPAEDGNYSFEPVSRTFVIAKAKQTLTADDVRAVYGDTGLFAALHGSAAGEVRCAAASEADAQIVTVDAESGALTFLKSGTARVTITAAGDANHEPGSVTITVTVEKRVIRITVQDAAMRAGEALPAFEAVYDNFAAGESAETVFESLAVLTTGADGSQAGSFPVTVGTLPVLRSGMEERYALGTPVDGTLRVEAVSSGGGGAAAAPTYPVSAPDQTEGGTVTVSPKNAKKGDTVTITVQPAGGYVPETVTVTDANGNELPLTDLGGGKYSFTMPAGRVEVKATFMEDNSLLNFFYDVPNDAYYYEAVKWAVEQGITTGVSRTLFDPNAACTRAQIVTFLWRAAGSPEPKSLSSFADVPADSYYAKAVAWAVENGITTGVGGGRFDPDGECTRAQGVTFLFRALGTPVDGGAAFGDVLSGSYYEDAVAWAVEHGVTNGIGGGLFGPDNDCTRAQIVTFLYRAYNK